MPQSTTSLKRIAEGGVQVYQRPHTCCFYYNPYLPPLITILFSHLRLLVDVIMQEGQLYTLPALTLVCDFVGAIDEILSKHLRASTTTGVCTRPHWTAIPFTTKAPKRLYEGRPNYCASDRCPRLNMKSQELTSPRCCRRHPCTCVGVF